MKYKFVMFSVVLIALIQVQTVMSCNFKPMVENLMDTNLMGDAKPTLSTGVQYISERSATWDIIRYEFRDSSSTSIPRILIDDSFEQTPNDSACTTRSDVYLGLYLSSVTYRESPSATAVSTVAGGLYKLDQYFGGTGKVNSAGCNTNYCMARLEQGLTNFDTNLIIKTDAPANLDAGAGRRVYTFHYELYLETKATDQALIYEKGVFPFQITFFMDRSDFYQCDVAKAITYYVATGDTYDLFCMYDGSYSWNSACNPAAKTSLTIEHNRLFSFVLDDSITELSYDSIININDQATTLYGVWEILFTHDLTLTKTCGILTVRSTCDGTYAAITTYQGKKIDEITIAYSYIRDAQPIWDYDLPSLVSIMGKNAACITNDHFEFNILGFRWQDDLLGGDIFDSRRRRQLDTPTASDKTAYDQTLFNMFQMGQTTATQNHLLAKPEIWMWPFMNQVVIQMHHLSYQNLASLNLIVFYLDINYNDNCQPDESAMNLKIQNDFTPLSGAINIELDGAKITKTEFADFVTPAYFIQSDNGNNDCPTPTLAVKLAGLKDPGGVYHSPFNYAHNVIYTFDSPLDNPIDPYPLKIDTVTNNFEFEATSVVDWLGTYYFQLIISAFPDTFEVPYIYLYQTLITVSVTDSTAPPVSVYTFTEILNFIEGSLPLESELQEMAVTSSEAVIELHLDSIVSLLGISTDSYASYSITAMLMPASSSYLELDQATSTLIVGPFVEEEILGEDLIEVVINLNDGQGLDDSISFYIPFELEDAVIEEEEEEDGQDDQNQSEEIDEIIAERAFEVHRDSWLEIELASFALSASEIAIGVMIPSIGSASSFDKRAQRLLIQPTQSTQLGKYTGTILIKNEADDSFNYEVFLIEVLEKQTDDRQIDDNDSDSSSSKDQGNSDQTNDDKQSNGSKDEAKEEMKIEEILSEPEIEELKSVTEDDIVDVISVQHNSLSNQEKQVVFNSILEARVAQIKEKLNKDPEQSSTMFEYRYSKPKIMHDSVEPNGDFLIFFSDELLGLIYMLPLDVVIRTKGAVSSLYADEEGLVGQTSYYKQVPLQVEEGRRNLLETSLDTEGDKVEFELSDYLKFELRRGDDDSAPASKLDYEISVERKETTELYLRISFENPQSVSIGSEKDILVAEVQDEYFFSRIDNAENIDQGTQVKLKLPRQFDPDDKYNVFVDEVHELLLQSASALMISNLVLTFFIVISLKAFWNLLNVIQVLVFLRNFTNWPAIVYQVLNQLFEAITLKPFMDPIFQYGKTTFEVKQSQTQNEFLQQQGVESKNVMSNLGIYLIFLALAFVIFFLYLLTRLCAKRLTCIQKILDFFKRYLFYQGPLRYVIVGYLRLQSIFTSMFLIGVVQQEETHLGLIFLYGFFSLALILWPLWIIYFLLKNYKNLPDPEFKVKFNALTNGIKLDRFSSVIYNAVFSVRRFDLILVNLFFSQGSPLSGCERNFYMEKILLFIVIESCYLGYIHLARPHIDSIFNTLEFCNEYALCALAYVMLLFAGVTWPLEEKQENNGRSISLLLILFIFSLNFFFNARIIVRRVCLYCKSRCRRTTAKSKQSLKESDFSSLSSQFKGGPNRLTRYHHTNTDSTNKEGQSVLSQKERVPHRAISEQVIPKLKLPSNLMVIDRMRNYTVVKKPQDIEMGGISRGSSRFLDLYNPENLIMEDVKEHHDSSQDEIGDLPQKKQQEESASLDLNVPKLKIIKLAKKKPSSSNLISPKGSARGPQSNQSGSKKTVIVNSPKISSKEQLSDMSGSKKTVIRLPKKKIKEVSPRQVQPSEPPKSSHIFSGLMALMHKNAEHEQMEHTITVMPLQNNLCGIPMLDLSDKSSNMELADRSRRRTEVQKLSARTPRDEVPLNVFNVEETKFMQPPSANQQPNSVASGENFSDFHLGSASSQANTILSKLRHLD